jgi:hypothetical protein
MSQIDITSILTILGSVSGWIFALAQYISNRERFRVEVARPDPEAKLECELQNVEGKQYLLSTICINNAGKQDLHIRGAVHVVDRPISLSKNGLAFHDLDEIQDDLLDIDGDMPTDKCQEKFYPEMMHIDYLKEFISMVDDEGDEIGHTIGHNENLTSHRLHLVEKPGLYRLPVLFTPNEPKHEELDDFIYCRPKIVRVPPTSHSQ